MKICLLVIWFPAHNLILDNEEEEEEEAKKRGVSLFDTGFAQ